MTRMIRLSAQWGLPSILGISLLALLVFSQTAAAQTAPQASPFKPLPTPDPKPGSIGIEATKTRPAPTQGATITVPGNGASFSTSPIAVSGICPNELLVQVFNNGVMVGAVMCRGGSFSLQASLFSGANEFTALVYDEIDQMGPPSNTVTVNYTDTRFSAFGSLITLTSSYARRSAAAGTTLGWPLQLSGGNGPYAFSIDWGDGSPPELKSQQFAGVVSIGHVYKKAGIYQVNIKVTDVNGVSAFLQLIAVSNGKVDGAATSAGAAGGGEGQTTPPVPQILWAPTAASLVLLLPSFWLGRRSQIVSLRNKMLKERDNYTSK